MNSKFGGMTLVVVVTVVLVVAAWFFWRGPPLPSPPLPSPPLSSPAVPPDPVPPAPSSNPDGGFNEVTLERIPDSVTVETHMVREPSGLWRQTFSIPKGATLVTLLAERTPGAANNASLEISVWGASSKLRSVSEGTNTLDAAEPAGTTVLLGPYVTAEEESISVAIRGAPENDSLYQIRKAQVWRRDSGFQPEGTVFDAVDVRDSLPATQLLAQNIAILYLPGGSCTGFAISDSLLLTNHHCISKLLRPNSDICPAVKIVFRHFSDDPADPSIPATCSSLVTASKGLDYALIRFAIQGSGSSQVQGLHVAEYVQPSSSAATIQVIQHPWGLPAQVSSCPGPPGHVNLAMPDAKTLNNVRKSTCGIENSLFMSVTKDDTRSVMTYKCDTQPGSSGSPVMQGNTVIALHFASDYRYYQKDGNLPEKSSVLSCLEANFKFWNWGRNICDVLKDARAAQPALADIPSCPTAPVE